MSDDFSIQFNGRRIEAHAGETILEAAERAGEYIPTLCHDPRLDPAGACRTCLVEIDGQRRLLPACATKCSPDMVTRSNTERVNRHLSVLLSLYLSDHGDLDELGLPPEMPNGNQLREMAKAQGDLITLEPVNAPREDRPCEDNPYFTFDPNLCILCARCTRYCDEVEGVNAITLAERGSATTIATANQITLMDSTCELCGGCVDTCPTGALVEKKAPAALQSEVEKIRSTCNFCGVGCQLDLNVHEGKIIKVTSPPPGETLNDGNLCVKGRFVYDFIDHEDRIMTPLIRREDGELHPASWEEAIETAAKGLLGVKERHGADRLGFISSSRCTGEENYLMQKLSRAAFGTNNCHSCAAT